MGMPSVPHPPQFLIVEDDAVLLRALYLLFQQRGYAIASATDGETALAMAQRIMPDCILLDLILPKVSGFDVLQRMRADPRFTRIPIIVLSNLGDQPGIDRAMALGATAYFVKAKTDLSALAREVADRLRAASRAR